MKSSGNKLINFDLKNNPSVKTFKIKNLSNTEILKTISTSKKVLGSIDCLIVCIYPKKYFPKSSNLLKNSTQNYIDDINENFGSYLRINLEFIRYFEKKKSGNIINFSSIYSKFLPRFEIYKNTKMGVPLSYFLSKNSIVSLGRHIKKISKVLTKYIFHYHYNLKKLFDALSLLNIAIQYFLPCIELL